MVMYHDRVQMPDGMYCSKMVGWVGGANYSSPSLVLGGPMCLVF